jgi:hypothetical protein
VASFWDGKINRDPLASEEVFSRVLQQLVQKRFPTDDHRKTKKNVPCGCSFLLYDDGKDKNPKIDGFLGGRKLYMLVPA